MNYSGTVRGPRSLLPPPWDSDLQVFGVKVSPGQQHGGKQVPRAHKHSVHFGNVHADFLTGNRPIWIHCNEEKKVNKPLNSYKWTGAATAWLPLSMWLTYLLAAKGHQVLVPEFGGQVCTGEDDSLRAHFVEQVHNLD